MFAVVVVVVVVVAAVVVIVLFLLSHGFVIYFWPHCGKNSEFDQEIPQSQTADNPWHRKEELPNHHETQ